jgi:hypothetical protein
MSKRGWGALAIILGVGFSTLPNTVQSIDSGPPLQLTPGAIQESPLSQQMLGEAKEGPVSLFGIRIGTPINITPKYVFVQEDESALRYILRNPTNPEYLIQSVNISKRSHIVVSVEGRTPSGPMNVCRRMLSETLTQLPSRYPRLKDRIEDDVGGTTMHLLSMERAGCSFTERITGMAPLRVPCSSSFVLYCESQSNAFIMQASDTEYTHLAREEAKESAMAPSRNHLD